jgi:hypothetical protein
MRGNGAGRGSRGRWRDGLRRHSSDALYLRARGCYQPPPPATAAAQAHASTVDKRERRRAVAGAWRQHAHAPSPPAS